VSDPFVFSHRDGDGDGFDINHDVEKSRLTFRPRMGSSYCFVEREEAVWLRDALNRWLGGADEKNPFETESAAAPQDLHRVIRSEIRAAFLSLAFEARSLDGYGTDRLDSAALAQIGSAAERAAAMSHHATQCPARASQYGEGCDCEEKPL
jgi:hypothetical protein